MGAQWTGVVGQSGRVLRPVVDVVDEGPLEGEAPTGGGDVRLAGIGQFSQWVAPIQRDQLVAQVVVRRMQRHRQVHWQPLGGHPTDAGHHADRRDGEVARRQPEVAMETLDGRPRSVIVGQRLTHAHEDHVGNPAVAGFDLGPHNLFYDLAGREVAVEAHLAGSAEAARHGASGLSADTHRGTVLVVHEHRLDE